MKTINLTFLRSKVARRIIILFISCALLPITVLAVVSFNHVTNQINDQTNKRLRQASKAIGMSIYERLLFLEEDLNTLNANFIIKSFAPINHSGGNIRKDITERFTGLVLLSGSGRDIPVIRVIQNIPALSQEDRQFLQTGKTLVSYHLRKNLPTKIMLWKAVDPTKPEGDIFVGEVNENYLWGLGDKIILPSENILHMIDQSKAVLMSSKKDTESMTHQIPLDLKPRAAGEFAWQTETGEYLAGFWTIPLKFNFGTPGWAVVLSESKDLAFTPLKKFRYSFFLILLLSLLIVALLSVNQVRRSLVPLEKLREGTRRIAIKDFANKVKVDSGDEFEDLSVSFNAMTDQLGKQFQILATISEIDRAILSSLHTKTIVDVVLSRIPDVLPTDQASVTLQDEHQPNMWRHVVQRYSRFSGTTSMHSTFSSTDREAFAENPDHLFVQKPSLPLFISPLAHQDLTAFLLLPIVRSGEFAGCITLGYVVPPTLTEEDLACARQLTNQVAIALANAKDVAERKKAESSLQDKNQALQEALAELKTTQHQIVQQERLRALGQMASGIAHDFNNTLTPIVGFTELLLMNPKSLENQEKALDILRLINTAGQDAAKVVSRLREFYKPRNPEEELLAPMQLNQLVKQAVLLTQPRWKDQALAQGSTLTIDTDLQDIPDISGNEAELREVLINLIFNAVDASPESGTITLRTYLKEQHVILEVSDTGMGMTEDVRQKCLEPFFSTKGDRGTGLGLSMVFGIIRRHQGIIDVSSAPGQGTTFTVSLPVLNQQEEPHIGQVIQQPLRPLHILVVEDDPLVCRVMMEYLAKDGHSVIAASDGEEALNIFEGEAFDAVVTDKGLPKLSGDQLAAAVKHRSPTTPVIMVTGLGDLLDEESKDSPDLDVILTKPITISALRTALFKVTTEDATISQAPPKP